MGNIDRTDSWRRATATRAGLGLAAVAASLLLAVGPAAAHEGAPTTTVAPAPAAATGGMVMSGPGASGPTVVADAPAAEIAGRGSDVESRGFYVLLVVGATAAAALVLRVLLPVFRPGAEPRPLNDVAAAALLFAGVAHCAAVPSHFAEGWMLGSFFVVSGLLLFGQAILIWLRPSVVAYGSVIASTTAFIVLYFLVREVSLPVVDHIDPYVFEEYPVKVAEGLAAVLAVAAILRARASAAAGRLAAR